MPINQVKQKKQAVPHANWMGGDSFDIKNPITRLRMAAASCFFGEPMYYPQARRKDPILSRSVHDFVAEFLGNDVLGIENNTAITSSNIMETAIDQALDHNIEQTLQVAVELRNIDLIRTTPQVILVRAANHTNSKGSGLIREYAPKIIKRMDEPATQLAYQLATYGKSIPNSLKKAWKDSLQAADAYQLSKYKMENREVKTVDVVRFSHANSPVINQLTKGELKSFNTWESLISEKGSNKETWTEALKNMGHMALLRNIRNLLVNYVDPELFIHKLVNGVEHGKQLPFRYYSAYSQLQSAPFKVLAAVEECLNASISNLPKFNGNVMSLCDNSGSAQGTTTSTMGQMQINTIANLTGVLTGMVADKGHVGIFGDRLETVPIHKNHSPLKMVQNLERTAKNIGRGTEHGIWLFWDKAIREKQHWDHVFVYSDMQAGHGELFGKNVPSEWATTNNDNGYRYNRNFVNVPKLINHYRKTVNPNINVYLVQVAGYQDTLIPEYYDRTYILGGWNTGVIHFAHKMANINNGQ